MAINHLLEQNVWALERLVPFAGKTARFEIAPFTFVYTILPDGRLEQADPATSADALCTIAPSLLPRLALGDENAYSDIGSEGDTALLGEIFFLWRNLKWDAAEDVSHLTGDIAAERIVQGLNDVHAYLRDSTLSLAQAAAEYWTEEQPLLAKPQHISTFMQQVDTLRDDVARLELRVNRLLYPSAGGR